MKRTLTTLSLLAVAAFATAQASFGIHAGLGLDKTTPHNLLPDCPHKFLLGPTLGVIANYQACEMLDIQAELNYSMRGYKNDIYEGHNMDKVRYTIKSSYIELPVIAKFYPFEQSGLNVQAGPQIGLLINPTFRLQTFFNYFSCVFGGVSLASV